jgi:hypothetical protein
MYETLWLAWFAAGILTTAVGLWGPEIEITVFASLANLVIWFVLALGATQFVVEPGGGADAVVYNSGTTALLCGGISLSSVFMFVGGLHDWWTGEEGVDTGAGQGLDELTEEIDS